MRRFVRKRATSVASRLRGFPIHPFNFSCSQKIVARFGRDAGKKQRNSFGMAHSGRPRRIWYYKCKNQTGTAMMDIILTLTIIATAALILSGSSWRDEW
jgi:hypothetical protein